MVRRMEPQTHNQEVETDHNDQRQMPKQSWTQSYWPQPSDSSHNWNEKWPQPSKWHTTWEHWPQPSYETSRWYAYHSKWTPPAKWEHENEWPQPKSSNDAAASSVDRGTCQAVAGSLPWQHPKVSVETETNRADLLLAQQRSQYEDDVAFLKHHEDKDRTRRQQYRSNLRERRYEAAERIAMSQEDHLDFWKQRKKRKQLSSRVWQVAHHLESKNSEQHPVGNQEIADLSATLPTTPKDFGTCDEEPAPKTPIEVPLDDSIEPTTKKQKTDLEPKVSDVALTLESWMVETFLQSQPTDLGLPRARILRKDPKFRWANHTRLAPRLGSTNSSSGVAPPYGAKLIEEYRKWQAGKVSP